MKTKQTIHFLLTLLAVCTIVAGCSRKPALTVRAFIDGQDVIKVRNDKLWIEHDTAARPGKMIYVNGQAWTPTWNDKVSTEFSGLKPPLRPRIAQKFQVTTRVGRGVVSIEQFPSAENDQTLAVRINDDDFGGADWYEISISW
jgi:signal peptidase I